MFFPKLSDATGLMNLTSLEIQKAKLEINWVLGGGEEPDTKAIEKDILTLLDIKDFGSLQSPEIFIESNFEKWCITITKELGIQNPETISVKRFYFAMDTLSSKK